MIVELQNITKQFVNGTVALSAVNFSVKRGEFVSVIGPSGAGKTTLFRILNGAESAESVRGKQNLIRRVVAHHDLRPMHHRREEEF